MRIQGKIALVTGAGQGIGEACAIRLAEDGADLALLDINQAQAEHVAQAVEALGRKALVVTGNVASLSDAQQAIAGIIKAFGRIDILVNNAGIARDAQLKNMTEEMFDAVIAVDLKGTWNCCKVVTPYMVEQRYGKIVSLSSRGAQGNFGQSNYSAAKAGVVGMTRALALEFARFNININAVAPGYIDTPALRDQFPQLHSRASELTPLRRIGKPRDVANAVLFLASDEASYITGQVLFLCGGRSIGGQAP
ncbi:MAG: SDR family oxidoreductase [Chloroflexi bacterium]|nr:SDR family oxidoreductase [Chloroflexota bacterium]